MFTTTEKGLLIFSIVGIFIIMLGCAIGMGTAGVVAGQIFALKVVITGFMLTGTSFLSFVVVSLKGLRQYGIIGGYTLVGFWYWVGFNVVWWLAESIDKLSGRLKELDNEKE